MENILKIIYDKSINNNIINLKDIEKILELLIIDKCLNDYISNINVQYIRSNNLASYSTYTKNITVYIKKVEEMVKNIENNILISNNFEIMLYKNLSILQVLLHEIEHANQQKISYKENSLEAFIIRISSLIENDRNDKLYEYCPEERLAEIKSYEEIINLTKYLNNNNILTLSEILDTEKLKRLLRGYHYNNSSINIPIIDYFDLGYKNKISNIINPIAKDEKYSLTERFHYGFQISNDEYSISMKKLVLSLNKNFNNRINIE
ncbi:MAG: hypothetical protein IJO32_02920 [Bacilli bacterium]|nr:hypothetical protein [Bacilli bacterium]